MSQNQTDSQPSPPVNTDESSSVDISEKKSEQIEKNEQLQVEKQLENLNINDTPKTLETAENKKQSTEIQKQIVEEDEPNTTELTETKYFVQINRTSIMFGKTTLFPGSIEEFDVSIGLKEQIIQDNGSNPYMLRVIARCNNAEFNDLDEYVFSVRSNERFEYFEEVRFKIRKKERAQVKVAVKIPPVRQNYVIQGFLEIQLESLTPVCLPIYAKCEVPQIICIKDLYKPDEDTQVIKIPAKKNQIRMPPIPFKNLSSFNFTLQIQAIANQSFANRPYDIITQNFVNCQANTQFFVNLQLKENMSYKGVMPTKDYIRKILVLKIKGSSIYYNYPMEIFVFESTNSSGMS